MGVRVDPEGVIMGHSPNRGPMGTPDQEPDTGHSSSDRRWRITARLVAGVFGVAAVTTGIISMGAYCLTTDGGDFRRLRSSGAMSTDPSASVPPVAVGPSCAVAPATGRTVDAANAAQAGRASSHPAERLRPPIDRVPRPELKTATFALG